MQWPSVCQTDQTAPCTALVIASSQQRSPLAINSAFLNYKNLMQAEFLAVESAKRSQIDRNRRDLFVAFGS